MSTRLSQVSLNSNIPNAFLKLAVPAVITNLLGNCCYLINMYFIGRFGNPAMTAGVGLATTFVAIVGVSIMQGTNLAQETLTSQAFGADEPIRCGTLLNRGRIIVFVMFVPIALIVGQI